LRTLSLPGPAHWQVYLPVLLLSLLPVFPLIRWAEQDGRMSGVFRGAVIVLALAMALAAAAHGERLALLCSLLLFFAAFNFLEGALPSLISRQVTPERRGAALGVYSTAQFLGGAAGGLLGGLALQWAGVGAVFAIAAALAGIWLCFASGPAPTGRGN
jgi:predicted MFS family arabinose efflux permease